MSRYAITRYVILMLLFSGFFAMSEEGALVGNLMEQLGVSKEQAQGGAGLLLGYAKDKLSKDDFSKVGDAVPELDSLLGAAPKKDALGSLIGGALGGGGNESLGMLASLSGPFSKLGLDEGMIMKFVPILLAYLQSRGGDGLMGMLGNVFGGGSDQKESKPAPPTPPSQPTAPTTQTETGSGLGGLNASRVETGDGGLIDRITGQLGVNKEQAIGGTGAIFGYARNELGEEEFGKMTEKMPEINSWVEAAPKEEKSSLGGMLGDALGQSNKSLGALAALSGPFSKLGLDEGMVAQYLPLVMGWVQEKGGDYLKGLMGKVFDGDKEKKD